METTEKKFSWHRLLIVIAFVLFATLVVGGSTYYVMGVQTKNAQLESDRQIKALEKQVQELAKKDEGKTEANAEVKALADWKTYTNEARKYSIKYPKTWVYKDYPGIAENVYVAFADREANLPPAQSDALATIDARFVLSDLTNDITTDPTKIKKETTTVAGKEAKKWTLLPGRSNDMAGDTKIVYVSIPLGEGKYLRLSNVDDKFSDIFLQMLSSISIN